MNNFLNFAFKGANMDGWIGHTVIGFRGSEPGRYGQNTFCPFYTMLIIEYFPPPPPDFFSEG